MPNPSELARVEEEARYAEGLTTPAEDVSLPMLLQRPQLFGDLNIRVAFIPEPDAEDPSITALAATIPGVSLQAIAQKLYKGKVELDITDGFGRQRSLTVTPAELIFLLQQCEKFVAELPS